MGSSHTASDQEPRVASGYRIGQCGRDISMTTDCTIRHTGCRSRSLGRTEAETVTERKEMSVPRKRTEWVSHAG